jgi:NAD(P) transhydrogenase subunit alpha
MKIATLKELTPGENRVALTPETTKKFVQAGFTVSIESGAGEAASFPDSQYEEAGATIQSAKDIYSDAEIILKVAKPTDEEVSQFKSGVVLVGFLNPFGNQDLIKSLASKKVTSLSMDMIPRISRAQKLDALSSQTNVAGYKAVIMAANSSGKLFPLMMTAAGTIQPARVLVIGVGVAGLQAIATAKRLGAVVEAFDTRPVVKEQVESLGGRFIEIDSAEDTEDEGGYAKEASEHTHKKELALIDEHASLSDVVITTAQIPNKPSPRLVMESAVKKMKHGSVIVDLAALQGGNCELTEAGKTVVKHGVTIMGPSNIPSDMALESSLLYARNMLNFILEITEEGKMNLDLENEVVAGSLITDAGEIVHAALKNGVKD